MFLVWRTYMSHMKMSCKKLNEWDCIGILSFDWLIDWVAVKSTVTYLAASRIFRQDVFSGGSLWHNWASRDLAQLEWLHRGSKMSHKSDSFSRQHRWDRVTLNWNKTLSVYANIGWDSVPYRLSTLTKWLAIFQLY